MSHVIHLPDAAYTNFNLHVLPRIGPGRVITDTQPKYQDETSGTRHLVYQSIYTHTPSRMQNDKIATSRRVQRGPSFDHANQL